jgi:hypothetical protein
MQIIIMLVVSHPMDGYDRALPSTTRPPSDTGVSPSADQSAWAKTNRRRWGALIKLRLVDLRRPDQIAPRGFAPG